jgi:hypothetical protein
MDYIKRGVAWGKTGVKKVYNIYMQEEADSEGIEYKYWKECDPGHMALTDDGWVTKLIKRKEYTNKHGVTNVYFVFPFKSFFAGKNFILNYEDYRGKYYRLNGASNKTVKELKLQSYVNSPNSSLMVDCYLRTGDRMAAFRAAFPNKKPKGAWGKRLVNAVFKQEKITNMVRERIKEELEKAGLNPVSVLEKLDKTWEAASDQEDIDGMLNVIDKYEEYLNFKDTNGEVSNQLSGGALKAITAAFDEPPSLIEETTKKMEGM